MSGPWSRWIGIPYVDQGRDEAGFDCWGLVRAVLRVEAGLDLPSYHTDYASAVDRVAVQRLVRGESESWLEVSEADARRLDVVVLRVAGRECHLGVVVGHGCMLHTLRGTGVVLEAWGRPRWRRRVRGFLRHEELV